MNDGFCEAASDACSSYRSHAPKGSRSEQEAGNLWNFHNESRRKYIIKGCVAVTI